MGTVAVLGGTVAGVAAAARLAHVGHDVTLVEPDPGWPDALAAQLGATAGSVVLDFPAPWRDLFTKSGRPAKGALGLHGLELVPHPDSPGDRGEQWYRDVDALGEDAAAAWRDLVDAADRTWQALRPLGLEAELTDAAVARAGLDPRRSLAHVARDLRHPVLADRVRAVATDRGLDPADAPAWLTSRLSIDRTFGRWQLVDAAGAPAPASALVDVLRGRIAARGVPTTATTPAAAVTIDTRDPGLTWHRPRRWRPRDTFVDQLLARPRLADPSAPGRFVAHASSPGGAESWAQVLSGALASYAAHAHLTGEDIRPTNTHQGHGRAR